MVLGIYGAGGMGREVLILAEQINQVKNYWQEIFFIDDSIGLSELKGKAIYTFDDAKSRYNSRELEVAIAIGEPAIRKILRERITSSDFSLATLVHPSVTIPECTTLGNGVIICCNNFISCDSIIGENVLVQPGSCIGHDSHIGKDTVISTYVCIAGGCAIGDETYIGMQVSVRDKGRIGSQTIIGMGSAVIRDIPDNVIAMGNPARAMKKNTDHRVFNKPSQEG